MSGHLHFLRNLLSVACAIAVLGTVGTSVAAEAVKATTAAKPAKAAVKPAATKHAPVVVLEGATLEQLEAAKLVYYGHYECEFKQFVDVAEDAKHPGYVDVKLGKDAYVMKPVLSSTGALRLEDVKGATLMVQIANKSMLLDVKAGRRLVDDCISPKQRELIEAAAKAKDAEAAASAASAPASAAASAVK